MSLNEQEIIDRIKKGDKNSFEQLIDMYQKKVYNIAYGILGCKEDAGDATQEAFLKVYRAIDGFNAQANFYTWLYRIASNVCMDMLRKRKRERFVFFGLSYKNENGDEQDMQIEDTALKPDEQLIKEEQKQVILKAIASLKDDYRIIVVLRDINGLSYDEIAEVLKLSPGTVKSRLNRARSALKDRLINNTELLNI